MKKWMIDIETLGIDPSCPVIQIGFCSFDWDGTTSDEHCLNISLGPQYVKGCKGDASTLKWWHSTPEMRQMFEDMHKNTVGPTTALNILRSCIKWRDKIWSSANFDIPILTNQFKLFGVKCPWAYYDTRDVRTIMELAGISKKDYPEMDEENNHNALSDCKFQVKCICDAYKKLSTLGVVNC